MKKFLNQDFSGDALVQFRSEVSNGPYLFAYNIFILNVFLAQL